MKSFALTVPLLAIASHVVAQSFNATFAVGFLAALKANNFNQLALLAQSLGNSSEVLNLLNLLSEGERTIFAPTDAAFSAVPPATLQNTSMLLPLFTYHTAFSKLNSSNVATSPNHTVVRSLLNDPDFVRLEGNITQVIVATKQNNTIQILNQPTTVSVVGEASFANISILAIDHVLTIPEDFTAAFTKYNLTTLGNALNTANLTQPLANARGITIFAPSDTAFQNAASTLQTLNSTQLSAALLNHVINGTSAYSTRLTQGSFTSAGGEPFRIVKNATGTFVTSGSSTAQVITSDIVTANGVIDNVLANTESDTQAAQAAYSTYSQAAATAATAVTAVTVATATVSTSPNGAMSNVAATTASSNTNGAVSHPWLLWTPHHSPAVMKLISWLLPLIATFGFTAAQTNIQVDPTVLQALLNALDAAGLPSLGQVIKFLNGTADGVKLISSLLTTANTVVFPEDASTLLNLLAEPSSLLPLIEYHTFQGTLNHSTVAASPNHTIARSHLADPSTVHLENGLAQAAVFTVDNGALRVLNQPTVSNLTEKFAFQEIIDNVLAKATASASSSDAESLKMHGLGALSLMLGAFITALLF
ncbi:hypothetical protein FRB99_005635 [Tulasnella sp. 403]|nr:hypothetical protein FRB99_005635 [Tulasnella sp. 403]